MPVVLCSVHELMVVVVGLTWLFGFTNGFHDAANVVATMISTRALSSEWAIALAVTGEFLGALGFGKAVALTVSQGLIGSTVAFSSTDGLLLVAAALTGASVWNLLTWRWGLPISSSHSLLGGLVGSGLVAGGAHLLQWRTVGWIAGLLVVTPLVGTLVTFLVTRGSLMVAEGLTPRANIWLRRWQWVSSFALAVVHGSNDAPKSMGMLALALGFVSVGPLLSASPAALPLWVVLSCAGALSLGAATGGWRLIHTLGMKLYRLRPIHGFCAQVATVALVAGSTAVGGPVSTTQIIASAVVGAGAAERPRAVRWSMVRELLVAWLVTIPLSGVAAAASFWVFRRLV
ncbi:MAG: inorganic phosphate transporter [Elusimicrobia bacterium]|nr:inorganic phosphate transporter [Elusimicrobiota bacterium]